ncbi:MAG: GDP-mannose 4,6-dehydratase [Deltaproteobacteria bacterium]|nr:GDP-mannose 4,6-dehydratase [Deltaproteobacteria bacterium]
MKKKTYLLTGVAGFIGSNLAEELLRQGHRIIGIDNLNPSYWPKKKQHNLESIQKSLAPKSDSFVFHHVDICDMKNLSKLFQSEHFDGVIALAALAGVQPSLVNPQSYAEVNVNGTLNLLECARQHHVKNFAFASSSSVYGGNQKIPFKESDAVNLPISPYAATKRAGELLGYTYHHLYAMNIACLRFFTVYGPKQRPDLAIYKFTRAMLRGELITLYGDGSSQRDYTYITDIVMGIGQTLQWLEAPSAAQAKYDIFNLGENQMTKLNDLVKILEANFKTKAKVQYQPYLPGDVPITCADITHSQQVLGYKPQVKIEEGLRKFCEWFVREEKDKNWDPRKN